MTQMPTILVSNIMMLRERDRFDADLRDLGLEPLWADVSQFMSEDDCLAYAGQVDGWLAGDDRITGKVLDAHLPRLRVISKWGTGVDSIDVEAARSRGVPVLNSPGAFAQAVGECAIGYMLMLLRDLGRIDREVRAGGWPKPRSESPVGKTLGVIGFGAIGQAIGRMGGALGMTVVFSDPMKADPVDLGTARAEPLDLPGVCQRADVLVLACNLTPDNHHMINSDTIGLMPDGAWLINVARGPLVRESDLVAALESGKLAGAALDVFEDEPLSADNPLRRFENVVLGSHNCNNEVSAVEYVHRNTIANLMSVLGEGRKERSDA